MTRAQFAIAVQADEKWIQNADTLLGRKRKYDIEGAVWLGLVRMLNQEMLLPLSRAAQVADEALRHGDRTDRVLVGEAKEGIASISIDMARFHSAQNAATSVALTMGGSRRRGRRRMTPVRKSDALENAAHYGVDVELLREGLKMTADERLKQLDENAGFLRAMRPARAK